MKKFISDIYNSLFANSQGFSARKLTALFSFIIAAISTFKFGDKTTVIDLTIVWGSIGLVCLGIVTIQQIIDFKTGRTTSTETKSSVTTVSEQAPVSKE